MPIAKCRIDNCTWQQYREDRDDALKLRVHHEMLRHPDVYGAATNQPFDNVVTQLADVDWWTQGIDVIAAVPAGRRFTLYEICKHLGEPPMVNGWQKLARDAHHLGLTKDVGGANSKRPGTRSSKTTLWERTQKAVVHGRRTA